MRFEMIEEGWLTKVKSIEVKIWGLVSKIFIFDCFGQKYAIWL